VTEPKLYLARQGGGSGRFEVVSGESSAAIESVDTWRERMDRLSCKKRARAVTTTNRWYEMTDRERWAWLLLFNGLDLPASNPNPEPSKKQAKIPCPNPKSKI